MLLKLHPDKLSPIDLKFITDNEDFLMQCFDIKALEPTSLLFFILEKIKSDHLAFIEEVAKTFKVVIYVCSICDQHCTDNYCMLPLNLMIRETRVKNSNA